MKAKKEISFAEKLQRLQEITEMLEDDNTEIEESLLLYEEGINLSKELYTKLNSAELKITELKASLENDLKP